MSWEMRCKCDGCGAWKGEGNKWLLAAKYVWGGPLGVATFLGFMRWDEEVAQREGVMHLCSDTCKNKLLGEHLAAPAVAESSAPAPLPLDERTYAPIECEYCGPRCFGGAEHHERVEAGDRYSDGGI